jgi:hypothetical protein
MTETDSLAKAHLAYSLICDDVRLEMGNKLSVMGIFQNIFLPALPSSYFRFVLLNHWEGSGEHTTEIKIISPDRTKIIAGTGDSGFSLTPGGVADNVTVFANVAFEQEGIHPVQIYLDRFMVREVFLNVVVVSPQTPASVN